MFLLRPTSTKTDTDYDEFKFCQRRDQASLFEPVRTKWTVGPCRLPFLLVKGIIIRRTQAAESYGLIFVPDGAR